MTTEDKKSWADKLSKQEAEIVPGMEPFACSKCGGTILGVYSTFTVGFGDKARVERQHFECRNPGQPLLQPMGPYVPPPSPLVPGETFKAFSRKDEPGRKDDAGKDQWDLLPWKSLRPVVAVLTLGAVKYAPENWKHVPNPKARYLSAAMRHIAAHAEGEWLDPETRQPHLAHATCCLLFLLWFGE